MITFSIFVSSSFLFILNSNTEKIAKFHSAKIFHQDLYLVSSHELFDVQNAELAEIDHIVAIARAQ